MSNKATLLNKDFHFGIGFLNELLDGTGLRLDQLGDQDDTSLIPKMMLYSAAYAQKRRPKGEPNISMSDIYDMIDDNGGIGGSFWNDFQKAFYASMNKDVPVDTSKKKATTKK